MWASLPAEYLSLFFSDFKVNNTACCPSSAIGQCIPDKVPCQNRTQYMFWDSFHPTEIFNIFYAERSYSALDPSYAYPYDIRHLISLDQGIAEAKWSRKLSRISRLLCICYYFRGLFTLYYDFIPACCMTLLWWLNKVTIMLYIFLKCVQIMYFNYI